MSRGHGRTYVRTRHRCEGCQARITIGFPKTNLHWAERLHLTSEQVDHILQAAAEYEAFSEDAGTISNAVEFIDWMAVDALRRERDAA